MGLALIQAQVSVTEEAHLLANSAKHCPVL